MLNKIIKHIENNLNLSYKDSLKTQEDSMHRA